MAAAVLRTHPAVGGTRRGGDRRTVPDTLASTDATGGSVELARRGHAPSDQQWIYNSPAVRPITERSARLLAHTSTRRTGLVCPTITCGDVDGPSVVTIEKSLRRWWWLVAVVAGLLLGPLDLWGQVNAPYPWANLFNSPSVWAAAGFAYGRWVRERHAAPVGAVIMLVMGVEAYYLADVLVRDASRANLTSSTAAVWLAAAVVAGLVFGVAGGWASERTGWRAVLGRAALPAVFGAEAVRNLVRLANEPADGRPDDLGQFALLLAALGITGLVVLVLGADRRTAVQVVAATAIAVVAVGAAMSAVL